MFSRAMFGRRFSVLVLFMGLWALAACLPGGPEEGIAERPLPPPAESAEAVPEASSEPEPEPEPAPQPLVIDPPAPPPLPPALAAQARQCAAQGGQLSPRGEGLFSCLRQTRDGGRQCRRAGDCEGHCLARSSTCAPFTPLPGCHDVFGQDGRRTTLCLD